MNKFNLNTCEFHILHNLDINETTIQDDVNIFYKRIEKPIMDDDEEFWLSHKQKRRNQTLDAILREANNSEGSDMPSDEA